MSTLSFLQVGDLHMDEANGWESLPRLEAIVAEANRHLRDTVDFVFLPGDNANHATDPQYAAIARALAPLRLPWRVIPGDHDYEAGDLRAYEATFPEANRPEVEVFAGHRCIFVDVVSAGAGGPDFRLTMHHRNRLIKDLARATADAQPPVVFMHAYPDDLAADGAEIAQLFSDAGVAFVATGHTHYNELLNDGRVVYGAVRSTGEIEEDGGQAGFALITIHDTVPSWRFKRIGSGWPFLQIVSPCDTRLVTRPADPRQIPRPGQIEVTARVFGSAVESPVVSVDDGTPTVMQPSTRGLWSAPVEVRAGLHRITVESGSARDMIHVLVRAADAIPMRRPPVMLGHACHSIGSWPDAGIDGMRLGPNCNGRHW